MSEKKSVLETERGNTTISDSVVTVIAGLVAKEVEGLRMGSGGRRLPGDSSPTVGEVLSGFGVGGQSASRGVFVEVGGGAAAVAVDVQAEYGTPVPGLVSAVREGVIRQVEGLTGLRVSEVNVTVSGNPPARLPIPQENSSIEHTNIGHHHGGGETLNFLRTTVTSRRGTRAHDHPVSANNPHPKR